MGMGWFSSQSSNVQSTSTTKNSSKAPQTCVQDFDPNGIDEDTGEKGVYKMKCGHKMGRQGMKIKLKVDIIQNKKQSIRCFYCKAVWEFAECKKIANFSQRQIIQFQTKLSDIFLENYYKACPKCQNFIDKQGLNTNRVVCTVCGYGDFCYRCLNKWNSPNSSFCGYKQCTQFNQLLKFSPTKTFNLKDRGTAKKYQIPKRRACPTCYQIIEHIDDCKHMTCPGCKNKFCFVCLSIQKESSWKCGGAFEYCGSIAPRQILD